jgi:hypothetical protein
MDENIKLLNDQMTYINTKTDELILLINSINTSPESSEHEFVALLQKFDV